MLLNLGIIIVYLHSIPCSLPFYTTIAFKSYIPCTNFLRENVFYILLSKKFASLPTILSVDTTSGVKDAQHASAAPFILLFCCVYCTQNYIELSRANRNSKLDLAKMALATLCLIIVVK